VEHGKICQCRQDGEDSQVLVGGKTGAYSMILKAKKPLSMSPIEFTRGDIHEKKRREIFALLTRSHKLARFEFVQNVR
jgi:hypothetical protein